MLSDRSSNLFVLTGGACLSSYSRVPTTEDNPTTQAAHLARRRLCTAAAVGVTLVVAILGVAAPHLSKRFARAAWYAEQPESSRGLVQDGVVSAAYFGGECATRLTSPKGGGERCFCLFAGHCKEDVPSCAKLSLEECQRVACAGRNALEVTADAASFVNMADAADVLTIPVPYYRDLGMLKACRRDAPTFLALLLEAGRRVFMSSAVGGPSRPAAQMQCLHLPGHVSVDWMHVHTFVGSVPGEALPARPPYAACANASMNTWQAAHSILGALR